jgi:predicted porin
MTCLKQSKKIHLGVLLGLALSNIAQAETQEDIRFDKIADNAVSSQSNQGSPKGAVQNKSEINKSSSFDFIGADAPFKYDFTLAGQPAHLQLYGVIDIARAHTNDSLPANNELPNNLYPFAGARVNPNVKPRTEWVNGGLQPSRIGFKGDIGKIDLFNNNFKLIYQFESGFNPIDMKLNNAAETLAENSGTNSNTSLSADSSLNGELFGRQAWAGIDGGKLGRLTYGTQYNPFFDIFAAYDPNSTAGTFSPFGESGTIGGGGGISENTRMKNSIKYANTLDFPDQGKMNYGVIYQNGNAAGTSHGNGLTAQLGYETNKLGIQLAYVKFNDSVKLGTAGIGNPLANNTISAALYNTDAALVALKWMPTKDIKISGGWEWYRLEPSSSQSIAYSSIFDQTVFGGVAKSALKEGFKQDNNVYFIGASYDFAERFPALAGLTSSVGYYDTKFDAIQGPTRSTNSEGNIDTWTFITDYKFNKRFDTYLAYTSNDFSGDKFPKSTSYSKVTTVGAGLRLRF